MIDQILKSGVFPPVLLLFGEEDLLVQEQAQRLYDASAAQDATGMNCEIVDGDGMTLDAVLGIARSFPMMSDRRVLWVRRFEAVSATKGKKGADLMEAYLKDPTASTFLLLTADIPKANDLGKAIQKSKDGGKRKFAAQKYPFNTLFAKGAWVEYPRMSSTQTASWLIDRTKERGLTMPPTVAEFLVARSGRTLRELALELDKVVTFLGNDTNITEEAVLSVVGAGKEYNVFELQKAVGRRDLAQSVTIVTKMLEVDRQEMLILAMLTRFFLSLFRLIDARAMSDQYAISKAAGIPPFAVADHLQMLDHLGARTVERGLRELRDAEATLKSRSVDAQMVLETMLVRILAP